MSKATVRLVLSVAVTLSLIPALLSAWQRIGFERSYNTVGMVVDYLDVLRQAREQGKTDTELLKEYQALGVNGVAVYEQTLGRLVQNDKVVYRDGSSWRNERISLGQDVSQLRAREYYLRSLVPGAAERFIAKYKYPTRQVRIDNQTWTAFPVDVGGLPAGPDLELIARLEGLGFFVTYRPFDQIAVTDPGSDFPKVPYLVYAGDSVSGSSDEEKLGRVVERTKNTITGYIESTDQKGVEDIVRANPTVRVFAIQADWQAVLQPEEVGSKFVLAARERNHRLLYLRPFVRIDDTRTFFETIRAGLAKANLKLGKPGPL